MTPTPSFLSVPTAQARPSATPTSFPVTATVEPSKAAALFDGQRAFKDVVAQMDMGDRPVGSAALRKTGDYIISQLIASGWNVSTQEFDYRGYPVRNILAARGQGPVLIVGAHYDARARADQDPQNADAVVPAANDGASGAAVLLELARVLDASKTSREVRLAFFDAEDDGDLDMCRADQTNCDHTPWPWSIGADYVASHLDRAPAAVIILDMVGDRDQQFYYEKNSDPAIEQQIWGVAAQLGYRENFIPQPKWPMDDDHTPFLKRGYRAVDIIDFDYPYWHTTQDTIDKVSPDSLERIGRVMQAWLEGQ